MHRRSFLKLTGVFTVGVAVAGHRALAVVEPFISPSKTYRVLYRESMLQWYATPQPHIGVQGMMKRLGIEVEKIVPHPEADFVEVFGTSSVCKFDPAIPWVIEAI